MNQRIVKARIVMIRAHSVTIGGKTKLLFWSAGGKVFSGRASHMKALKAARLAAEKG